MLMLVMIYSLPIKSPSKIKLWKNMPQHSLCDTHKKMFSFLKMPSKWATVPIYHLFLGVFVIVLSFTSLAAS